MLILQLVLFKSILGLGKCVVEPLTKQFGWVQGSHVLTELQKALFWFHVKTSKIGKSCSADKCFLSQNDLKKKKRKSSLSWKVILKSVNQSQKLPDLISIWFHHFCGAVLRNNSFA